MTYIFWMSVLAIALAYLGYPLWLWVRSLRKRAPIHRAPIFPLVSIVIAACNEAKVLPAKVRNLLNLNYPADRLEVILVSNGSTDGTAAAVSVIEDCRVRVFSCEPRGKAVALNVGVGKSRGDVVVFADARQFVETDALGHLVESFADPCVGAVSGELMLGDPRTGEWSGGVGLYWRMEKKLRQWESASSSVVGATGAFYAVRKQLVPLLPEGTVLDDLLIPLHVARAGRRVVFEPRARVWDQLCGRGQEFQRKVRTLAGNYQLLRIAPWVLSSNNPLRFEFVCHKLLRLMIPFALLTLLASSIFLSTTFTRAALLAQLIFYVSAVFAAAKIKVGFVSRIGELSLAFGLLNLAALAAFFVFVAGREIRWGTAGKSPEAGLMAATTISPGPVPALFPAMDRSPSSGSSSLLQ